MGERKAVIVGLSGCSSSGKTTLARLLRDMFPNTFIIHQDDFYKHENELPIKAGHRDWDCAESLNLAQMEKSLDYIRETGKFPPDLNSIEDQNAVGPCPVSPKKIALLKTEVAAWSQPGQPGHGLPALCLVDGFLLYYPPALDGVMARLDLKLFLRASRDAFLQRRKARAGYVTVDGFWTDPEGYAEDVVWPNYVESHAWLFEGDDVEGSIDEKACNERDIRVLRLDAGGLDADFETSLEWAVDLLMAELPGISES